MPNIYVATNTGSGPLNVAVSTSSGALVAESSTTTIRAGLIVTNLSSGTIYLAFDGNTALLNAGVALTANGGVWSMDDFTYTKGAVNAIGGATGMSVAVQEFYR